MPATASLTHEREATDVPPDPDPNFIQAMKSMTDNIVAVIDAKISMVLEAIDNARSLFLRRR